MSPPPAATVAGATQRRAEPARRGRAPATSMPRGVRRASGPSGGLGALRAGPRPAVSGGTGLARPLGARMAHRAAVAVDARVLDRLIQGRVWIVLVGSMLIGLVFLQLSLLNLNTGIGQALATSQGLQRRNDALRTQVSTMVGGGRVQAAAAREGLVMPTAGARHYLRGGAVSPAVAARRITAPRPVTPVTTAAVTAPPPPADATAATTAAAATPTPVAPG